MKVAIKFFKALELDLNKALDEQRATIQQLIHEKNMLNDKNISLQKVITELQNEYVDKKTHWRVRANTGKKK